MEENHFDKFGLTFENNLLSYCGQECRRIPPALQKMYGAKVKYLDLRNFVFDGRDKSLVSAFSEGSFSEEAYNEALERCRASCDLIFAFYKDIKSRFLQNGGHLIDVLGDAKYTHDHYKCYNSIETLKGLEDFTRLEELILDNNKLGDGLTVPYLPRLKTLSLNNNQIVELEGLVNKISDSCPAITYLSLLSNKACPNELSDLDKDDSDYQRYRYYVIYKLPKLRFLDSRRVSSSERIEAATRGQFMRVRRPVDLPEASPAPVRGPMLRPLPVDFGALGKHKGAYGKCQYKYTGKHSEGNRFIVNSDL